MLLFNMRRAANKASLDHQMSANAHRNQEAKIMAKLIITTLAAAIALGSVSTAFAAPKQNVQPQKVQEPIYFTLATGEN